MPSEQQWATLSILEACRVQDIPANKSPVQSCDSNYSSQHRQQIKTEQRVDQVVTVVWLTVRLREKSLVEKTPFSSAQNPFLLWKRSSFPTTNSRGWCMSIYMFQFLGLPLVLSAFLYRVLTQVAGSDQTTGMILILLRPGTILIPAESLLVLDLQDGRVVVQDGQDDFVHVLTQTQVNFFLLLQGFH